MPDQRHRPARHPVLVVLLALGLLALAAGPATAQPLECGDRVTQDTTLTADLLDCPEQGLIIGADGITVDLNGHTISGQILTSDPEDTLEVGIDNSEGHDDVTIRNGEVRFFARGGVYLVGADRNRVQGLTMRLFREFGILLEGGSGNQITGNTLDAGSTVGIGIFGAATPSRDNRITGNVANSAKTANIALRFGTITGTLIEDNTSREGDSEDDWGAAISVGSRYTSREGNIRGTVVRSNRMDFNFSGGVFVSDAAPDTLVERNLVDNSFGLPAIESDGDRTLIRRNTIRSSYFVGSTSSGVQVDARAEDNRVELNTMDRVFFSDVDDSGTRTLVSANVMTGQIFPDEPITGAIAGIVVREEASDGRILANVVRRHSPGIGPDTRGGIWILGDNITVAANVVDQIDADGIRVEAEASGTLLKANVATRNREDGIDVRSPATTVTANVANDNTDLGIEADVPGVTDGGGNRASGNGNPAQCVGVRCSP